MTDGMRGGLCVMVTVLALTTVALTTPLMAQSTTGTISGRVVDGQGLGVPGVTITATSPNLQGSRETVASANGDYILSLLPSGVYTLSFQLTGFDTAMRTVTVAPTQTVTLEIELGVAALSESVQVVGRSADVFTQTAQVATNFAQEMIRDLPNARDLNAIMQLAPSVHPTGPNGGYSIAGSASFDNLFLVNGVTINENLRGQAYDLYIEDAVQETTIATAGISAEYGRFGGGVVNVVTKSGGNRFSGSFRDTLNNDKWRRLTPFEESPAGGVGGGRDLRIDKVVPTYEYTVGGPVLRDRIWFFTAGRLQKQESGRNTAITAIPYPFIEDAKRFEGKGTYALNSSHRFQAAYTKHSRSQENNTFNPNLSMDLGSNGTRELPEDLFTFNYTGVVTPSVFVEGRYSNRHQKFIGNGSPFTDLERGTLLIDRSRGNTRYWTDTFCGVCDPESRDNEDIFVKGSYFLSTAGNGSHSMTFGYDNFNDKRFANNRQSGSDYRILGTSTIIQGTGSASVIYPQFLGDGSTIIQWNPIPINSTGSNFRTHSLFYNDSWRVSDRVTANLGIRYDKNDGQDQAGKTVVTQDAWSPRLGIVWDPTGAGSWSVTGSVAKYVSAISNNIADASSAAGNSQTRQYIYRGPNINPTGATSLVTSDVAIRQLFDWYNANGGSSLPLNGAPTIPGVSPVVGDLSSPNVWEYAGGINRAFGSRATVRADVIYRTYGNFYADFTMPNSRAQDAEGRSYDLVTIANDAEVAFRKYAGLTLQGTYRWTAFDVGGNYTLSRNWGNFEGESVNGGPLRFEAGRFSEYRSEAWNFPEGDLSTDQRHRSRIWMNYRPGVLRGLSVSLLQLMESGIPYGSGGRDAAVAGAVTSGVDPRPYVTNPGYLNPPSGTDIAYYYTARDAFRTESQFRTDMAVNYTWRVPGGGGVELFGQLQVLNLFDQSQLCACGGTAFGTGGSGNAGGLNIQRLNTAVLTPVSTPARFAAFTPFTTTPVRGVNWDLGPNFGQAVSRFAYTTPQSMRLTFGVRF
jgi:outer membrane receptor protein involved in Fe transport